MKEDVGEGGKLRAYLKKNKINQDDLAVALGYKGRHGLVYHFEKDVLDYEFKMKLRAQGIKLFDENGKLISTSEREEQAETIDLSRKYTALLEEHVQLQKEVSRLREEVRKRGG